MDCSWSTVSRAVGDGRTTRAMHVRPGIIVKLKRGNERIVRHHQRVFPPHPHRLYDPDTPSCLRWILRSSPRETVRAVSSAGSTAISTFSGSTSSFCELNSSHFGFAATLVDSLHSTFVPLFFSVILYASNGENHVSYVDCLFLCVTSATVTGLATIDLSLLTAWQQVILFVQMFFGSPVS